MSASQSLETGQPRQLETVNLSEGATELLGQEMLAEVIPFPAQESTKPGMEATMAFVNWVRDNNARGFGKFGVAEYKRDEDGRLYVDHHGPKVYLY